METEWEAPDEAPPKLRNHWYLMVTEEGESFLFRGVVSGKLSMHWMALHPWTFELLSLNSVGFFLW